ncbi:TauD/TfdA dioxygenase family protein [Arenicellales bacterium nBUS_45]
MNIHPISGSIGAVVTNIDLKNPISDKLTEDLRNALDQYLLLTLPDQHLDATQHLKLCEVFGSPIVNPYGPGQLPHPELTHIIKEKDDGGGVFGGGWHTDLSFLEEPPSGSILCAIEVPPYGGDTLFSNQQMAWETLPDPLKAMLDNRKIVHVGKPYGIKWAPPLEEQSMKGSTLRNDPNADRERFHPAILRHPKTQRPGLYLNPTYSLRLDGMSEAESRPILDSIMQHATLPEFCCRISWSAGMVAVWDNFSTQHYAVNDYFGFRREMRRASFSGYSIQDYISSRPQDAS